MELTTQLVCCQILASQSSVIAPSAPVTPAWQSGVWLTTVTNRVANDGSTATTRITTLRRIEG